MIYFRIGEALSNKLVDLFSHFVTAKCCIWNCYGPSETTLGATCHLIDLQLDVMNVPIGKPSSIINV